MSLHLITGYAGQEHITSADQGAYNMGTYGTGEFVLSGRGQEFKATVLSNNSISIADGEAMMQGRFIKMPIGTTESLSIDNGTQGNKRCDLIVIRYNKNSSTGVETTTLAVVKGTEGSSYVEPSVVRGTITDGDDIVNEMKLYAVRIDGISIASVVKRFATKVSMIDYMANYQLPVATNGTLGGIRVGATMSIDELGNINYILPSATSSEKGGIYINSNWFDEDMNPKVEKRRLKFYPRSGAITIGANASNYDYFKCSENISDIAAILNINFQQRFYHTSNTGVNDGLLYFFDGDCSTLNGTYQTYVSIFNPTSSSKTIPANGYIEAHAFVRLR